jgi:hypothetical protein
LIIFERDADVSRDAYKNQITIVIGAANAGGAATPDARSKLPMDQRFIAVLAQLHVIAGGAHDLASTHADAVAPLIDAHLRG